MTFAKEVLLRPIPVIWGLVTGVLGVAAFLGMGDQVSVTVRVLTSLSVLLGIWCIGLLMIARDLHARVKAPVRIRSIVEGTHFYEGSLIIILDRASWIEVGQLLSLVAVSDAVQTPLALLRVETQTTEQFPQCVVVAALTKDDLAKYLSDRSRWLSLSALPEIKSRYLEARPNG